MWKLNQSNPGTHDYQKFPNFLLSFIFLPKMYLLFLMVLSTVCVHAKSLQSCLTLCDPMDCNPPSSSVHGILQAKILEWVVVPSSRGSSQPKDRTHISCVSCVAGRVFTTEPLGKPLFIITFHYFRT